MKKINKKKGFTIVELVIVIAVIAILAAVLIPTFSNVIGKANESAALQEARNAYTEVYAKDIEDGVLDMQDINKVSLVSGSYASGTYTYTTESNAVKEFKFTKGNITVTFNGSKWTTPAS